MSSSKFQPVESSQNEKYMFSNGGFAATARLNFQYYLWGAQAGYQISPTIPLDKKDIRIADVGTGTAIWLIELSRQLPTTSSFHGFDLETDLLPRAEWLPPNVSFHTLDVFEEVPEQYIEKYDVVHLRLLSPVVQKDDPLPVLKTALKLLKPGGWIQWDEKDYNVKVQGGSSGKKTAMEALIASLGGMVKKANGYTWIWTLDKTFEDAGLEGVSYSRHETPKELWGPNQDLIFQIGEEASFILDQKLGNAAGEKLRGEIRDAYVEHRTHGSVSPADLVVCVGRKKGGE